MWDRTSPRMRLTSVRSCDDLRPQLVVGKPLEPVDAEAERDQLLRDAVVDVAGQPLALLDPGALPQTAEGERDGDEALVLPGDCGRGLRAGRPAGTGPPMPSLTTMPYCRSRASRSGNGELHAAVVEDDHTERPWCQASPMTPWSSRGSGQGTRSDPRSASGTGRSVGAPMRTPERERAPDARKGVEEVLGGGRRVEPGAHLRGQTLEPGQQPRGLGGQSVVPARVRGQV